MADQLIDDPPHPLCFTPQPQLPASPKWSPPCLRSRRIKKTTPTSKPPPTAHSLQSPSSGSYIDSEGRRRRIVFVISERDMLAESPKPKVSQVIRELADRFKRALLLQPETHPFLIEECLSPLSRHGCPISMATLETMAPSESEAGRSDVLLSHKEGL